MLVLTTFKNVNKVVHNFGKSDNLLSEEMLSFNNAYVGSWPKNLEQCLICGEAPPKMHIAKL